MYEDIKMELLTNILFKMALLIGVTDLLLVCLLYFVGLTRKEVIKGNKDQQEIKTRLTALRNNLNIVKRMLQTRRNRR